MINKIILYDLEERCKALKSEGNSNSAIARLLTEESKIPLSNMAVSRFFKSEQCALQQAIHSDSKLQIKKAETYLNVVQQLSDINRDTLGILKTAKAAQEHKIALLAIQRVEKQLELQSRLLGELDESPKVVTINVLRAEAK